MIVWGGFTYGTRVHVNTGGRYDPSSDSWTATNTADAPRPDALTRQSGPVAR